MVRWRTIYPRVPSQPLTHRLGFSRILRRQCFGMSQWRLDLCSRRAMQSAMAFGVCVCVVPVFVRRSASTRFRWRSYVLAAPGHFILSHFFNFLQKVKLSPGSDCYVPGSVHANCPPPRRRRQRRGRWPRLLGGGQFDNVSYRIVLLPGDGGNDEGGSENGDGSLKRFFNPESACSPRSPPEKYSPRSPIFQVQYLHGVHPWGGGAHCTARKNA